MPCYMLTAGCAYLAGAVNGDHVGLHLGLSLLRNTLIRGRRLKKEDELAKPYERRPLLGFNN